jgi:cation:H+ antiporter
VRELSPAADIAVFAVSLGLTLASAALFARTLDRLGIALGLPEALIGLLTALAADGPELTSALVAIVKNAPTVGLGVVLGSNVFNLAAMVGLGAVVAGELRVRRPALLLEGGAGVMVLAVVAALLAGAIPAAVAVAISAAIGIPYVALVIAGRQTLHGLHAETHATEELASALAERKGVGGRRGPRKIALWPTAALLVPAIGTIIAGSTGMVEAALDLADRWSVPHTLVGALILATLTSVPNSATAVRLARMRRGAAVVSETINSNTINLVFGIAVPALFVATAPLTGAAVFDLLALAAMTAVALGLLAHRGGFGRRGGACLLGFYVAYVAVHVVGGF